MLFAFLTVSDLYGGPRRDLTLHTKISCIIFVLQGYIFLDLEILIALHLSGWKAIPQFFSHAANLLRSSCCLALSCLFRILLKRILLRYVLEQDTFILEYCLNQEDLPRHN